MTLEEISEKFPPTLSPEEQMFYAQKYFENRDEESRKILFDGNQRLILKVIEDNRSVFASHIRKHVIGDDDLFIAGAIGLMNAVDSFDPNMGTKFSTYAYPAIYNMIAREIDTVEHNRKFENNIVEAIIPLSTPIKNENSIEIDATLEDFIPDEESDNFITDIQNKEDFKKLIQKIQHVWKYQKFAPTKKRQELFWEYLGLNPQDPTCFSSSNNGPHKTFDSLSAKYGTSRQVLHGAFQKMAQNLKPKLANYCQKTVKSNDDYDYYSLPNYIEFQNLAHNDKTLVQWVEKVQNVFADITDHQQELSEFFWEFYGINCEKPRYYDLLQITPEQRDKIIQQFALDNTLTKQEALKCVSELSKMVKDKLLNGKKSDKSDVSDEKSFE